VNNVDMNEQFDSGAEERKADVLRAQDIIPPLRAPSHPAPISQEAGKNMPPPPAEVETSPEEQIRPFSIPEAGLEQIKKADDVLSEAAKAEEQKSEIPRFDLAEDIMAEQRRITAVRRKGPGQKDEAEGQEREAEPAGDAFGQRMPALSGQEQIVADIVSRDIARLCRGGTRMQ
jgi:hypothetical protein